MRNTTTAQIYKLEKIIKCQTSITAIVSFELECFNPLLPLGCPDQLKQSSPTTEFLATEFIKPTQELLTKLIYHFCAAD